MSGDVAPREFLEVRRVDEADFPAFLERRIDAEAVAHGTADHPERADTDCRRAVDEHRAVRRVVGDLQELVDLRVARITIDDRNIEVLQACLLDSRTLFICTVLRRLTEIQHRLHAIGFELGEVFQTRLATGAELRRHLQKIVDGRQLLRL